jgi:hypothetical protein
VPRSRVRARSTDSGYAAPAVYASPLAGTPYDLRHAAVSTMLNAGISPTDVAEIAGQSPEVLWRNYAKCLDGGVAELRRRMAVGYGGQQPTPGAAPNALSVLGNVGPYSAQMPVGGQ